MPIYAYRCDACGHVKDVLQKLSDPVLTTCPACGADSFKKQVTAAGFQLKGSGWYVTDFRGGNTSGGAKPGEGEKGAAGPADGEKGAASSAAPADAGPSASPAPAPAAAAAASPVPTPPKPGGGSSGAT